MSWLKRHLPKKRWKRVVLYFLSVLVLLLAGDMLLVQYWRHIDVGPDTTRITAPLNAYGTPDYLAAENALISSRLLSTKITTENNAASLLIEAIGTDKYPETFLTKALPKLGLPATGMPSKLVTFVEWARKQPAAGTQMTTTNQNLETQADEMKSKPWKAIDHPLWAKWLDAQNDSIGLALRASERPRCYFPLVTGERTVHDSPGCLVSTPFPYLSGIRSLSNLLASDAMLAASACDIERFQRDIVATMKLARLVAQGPTLIQLLYGMSIEIIAYQSIDAAAMQPGMLSTQQCRSLIDEIDGQPDMPGLDRSINTAERWSFLDECCYGSAFGLDRVVEMIQEYDTAMYQRPGLPAHILGLVYPVHYNQAMRDGNAYYDRMVVGLRLPTYSQQHQAMKALETEITDFTSESTAMKMWHPTRIMMAMLIPSVVRVTEVHQSCIANRQLARVALDLAAYRAEKGSYPESLKDLAGGVLKEIPSDPFADAPLIYRRQGTGYVLYSVGPDGKDDGGIDRKAAKNGQYDIVVRAEH